MPDSDRSLEITTPAQEMESAIARACAELGVDRSEAAVEVVASDTPTDILRLRITARAGAEAPEADDHLRIAQQTLAELLANMQVQADVRAYYGPADPPSDDAPIMLDVQGEDLSLLIGRKGETLAALQYITRLIVSKELSQGVHLIVDVAGYRVRREEQLRRLARRMAEQAMQRGRTLSLEPMPANERRIVHLELRDHPDVRTESVGEGDRRKVTIIPKQL